MSATTDAARLQAVTEAVILWRDRPNGDIGLAIALAAILDTDKPEPPTANALVRVLRECDRLHRAHANADGRALSARDEGVLKAVSRIRVAAEIPTPAPSDPGSST